MSKFILLFLLSFSGYADDSYYNIQCWKDSVSDYVNVLVKVYDINHAEDLLNTQYKGQDCRIVDFENN